MSDERASGGDDSWHQGTGAQSLVIYGADGYAVADAKTFHGKIERVAAESNAQLIAAAPDLLDALQGLLRLHQNNYRETSPEEVAAEYAIAKARAE